MTNHTISKSKPSMVLSDLFQTIDAAIVGSVRAMLISRSGDGFVAQEVFQGESVLNIRMDLIDHLNDCAYPDDWLNKLKDSIDQRMAQRQLAKQAGSLSVPSGNGWKPIAAI